MPGGSRWVRVGLGETTLRATLATLDMRLALAVVLVLAFSVSIAVLLSQLITRPILRLNQAVRSASLTHLPAHTEPSMEDEIGAVTRAFNEMTDNLGRSRDALIAQNRELMVLGAMAHAHHLEGVEGSPELAEVKSSLVRLAPSIPWSAARTEIDNAVRGERHREAKLERLGSFGWVDRNAGVAHIPIDRAMDLFAKGVRAAPGPGQEQRLEPGGQP